MELNQVVAVIEELAQPYADRRLNVCSVEPAGLEGSTLHLRGRVLESANLQALVSGLQSRFPRLEVDASEVEVGRKTPPRFRVVGTNLTSMHDGTSFLAEQVTQMLNGMRVEILWEDGRWAFVRQDDGYLGWTYLPYLSEDPAPETTHLVIAPVTLLRDVPNESAGVLTRVLGGTGLCAVEHSDGWVRVELAGGWKGWLPSQSLRALNAVPVQAAVRREQLVKDARRMIGVPYLWGGNSANGIDCSGFAQLLHRWVGITIPRDADMQYAAGEPVEPPFAAGDLLFFGEKGEKRRITHVGISLGGWTIMHSSRRRNGVQMDNVQDVEGLREDFLCAATYIGR